MANNKTTNIDFLNCNGSITAEAFAFLGKKTKGLTYYDIFLTILQAMVTVKTTVKSGWGEVTLEPGQVAISNEMLAAQFKLNPKTMKNIVNQMEKLDLIRIHRSTATTVIDVVFMSGWYKDGRYQRNDLYLHAKKPRLLPPCRIRRAHRTRLRGCLRALTNPF